MQTSLTFKNLDPSDTLKEYVSEKLNRFDKYLDNPAEANVVLSVEKFRHIAEIQIIGDRLKLNSREETNDMYSSIDTVLDKIEKQIKKNKDKIKDRRAGGKPGVGEMMAENMTKPIITRDPDRTPNVVVRSIDYKPMDVEEAVMQMELTDDYFLVFTNAGNGRVNVLFRRKDGDYGLIQPN